MQLSSSNPPQPLQRLLHYQGSSLNSTLYGRSNRPVPPGKLGPVGPGRRRGLGRRAVSRLAAVLLLGTMVLMVGCDRTDTVQRGLRGLGSELVYDPDTVKASLALNAIPEPEYRDPPFDDLPKLSDEMQNVQVLNDLNVLEFSRLMQAMSTWVAPEEGCEYCHNTDDMASDEKYPKIVARRMLLMVRDINTNYKNHVADTGVTCWTCHRGQNVPSGIWFNHLIEKTPGNTLANRGGQNLAGVKNNGNAALPFDPLTPFLEASKSISVQGKRPLAGDNRKSIKQAEWTYSLMMYMSNSLGVNCNYCHLTRALARWEESTPQRVTAWHGIRMVRDLNQEYLNPLKPVFPAYRLGPEGDAPKVGCETCHKGAYKPLFGVTMLNDYGELRGVVTERPAPWELEFLEEPDTEAAPEEQTSEAPQDVSEELPAPTTQL
ncbi:MAG: photosynthetic reaction center cytochrome PufC [Sedimenticolaceae bacterium]